ncbi:MAG TPA: 16S rRNA pseudouridine(516) synthase [Lachnospiraceae bacterium]|nr:16S rRNA pseudouridine(516) synthase [Lachnospiraceae bacterium]
MRLDRYLADCKVGTRNECKKLIKAGRVSVMGSFVTDCAYQVKEGDEVAFDGKSITLPGKRYFLFNKPAGVICANEDNVNETIFKYFDDPGGLISVGRLDKDTEGLLIVTDDGDLCHRIISPKKEIQKRYYFEAKGELKDDAAKLVSEGLDIGDEKLTRPGILEISHVNPDSGITKGYLTITEGRFHQVKRMIYALGGEVIYLRRVAIGSIKLDSDLEKGTYRYLSTEEIESFK